MSKELTEKWNDRELLNGLYYVKEFDGKIYRFEARGGILWRDSNNPVYASERIEVLAPVPSYDEYKSLQEQLKEANNVIKYYGMGVVTRTACWAGQPYMRPEETTSFPEKALEYLKKWKV